LQNEIWIIGDVHGEFDKLMTLINKLPKNAHICFVGDLIDRGKKSAQVLDFVMNNNYDCVIGNHEIFMLENHPLWYSNYGIQTIRSYYDFGFEKKPIHIQYLKRVPYFKYYEFQKHKPLVVSHSYIHDIWQGREFAYTEKEFDNMVWQHMEKPEKFNPKKEEENGIFNIFGHTVLDKVVVTDTYAMIDTGACFQDGKLTAICYPSLEVKEV